MRIIKNHSINQKGITLVEVMICVVIVAMIIGPLTLNFTTAGKTRESAQRVTEATNNAEALMEDIKTRITNDILLKQVIDGNRDVYLAGTPEKERYDTYIKKYIIEHKTMTSSYAITDKLDKFLGDSALVDNYTKDDNGQERFAYEIAMWPLTNSPVIDGGNQITLNATNLADSKGTIKLYTSDTYNFTESGLYSMSNPVTFKVDTTTLKAFKDSQRKYIPVPTTEPYILLNQIKGVLNADGTITNPDTTDTVDTSPRSINTNTTIGTIAAIKDSDGHEKGYIIPIEKAASVTPDAKNVSVLELDITDLNAVTTCDDFTYKIVNNTGNDLIVRVIQNYKDATTNGGKFHFVGVNSKDTVRTSFEYIDDRVPEQNYLITMIVRELDPVIGEPGKIVKRMVSVYSFEESINDRKW